MVLHFFKYHGAGNDFILIHDNRKADVPLSYAAFVPKLCHRHTGIGADGVVFVTSHTQYDFAAHYYNADGTPAVCGNGMRCAVHLANALGLVKNTTTFWAKGGTHHAYITEQGIACSMAPVAPIVLQKNGTTVMDTGTLHHVQQVSDVHCTDVVKLGRSVRYNKKFQPSGINATFVTPQSPQQTYARTYERGVEAETLACGTGAVAAALFVAHCAGSASPVEVGMPGGKLQVSFARTPQGGFSQIYLRGPAVQVFSGKLTARL